MDTILGTDPNLLLIVAQITPTTDDDQNTRVQAYNAAISGLVQSRATAGKHVAMVDMYTPFIANPNFKTEDMFDKLHPGKPGYEIIAATYYAAVGPLLH